MKEFYLTLCVLRNNEKKHNRVRAGFSLETVKVLGSHQDIITVLKKSRTC